MAALRGAWRSIEGPTWALAAIIYGGWLLLTWSHAAVPPVLQIPLLAWFIAWVRKHGFAPFAVYRIVAGILVLVYAARLSV